VGGIVISGPSKTEGSFMSFLVRGRMRMRMRMRMRTRMRIWGRGRVRVG